MPSRGGKKEKKNCTEHLLSMKPRMGNCYFAQSVNVDLCRMGAGSWRGKKTESTCYEGPIFNHDRNFSTPTFILPSEKKNYLPTNLKNVMEIDRRYSSYDCEKSLIFVPKPNSKSMYCSVCKEKYEDYLEHIDTHKHRTNIRSNTFTKFIYEQTEVFKQKNPFNSAPPTSADTSNVIVISSDSEDCSELGRTRKKVKRCAEYEKNKGERQEKQIREENEKKMNLDFQFIRPPVPYLPPTSPFIGTYPFHFNFNYNINLMSIPGVLGTIPPPMPNFNCLGAQPAYTDPNFVYPEMYGFGKPNEKKNYIIVEDDKQ